MESLAGEDDRLRTVFNVLDENSTGYISVDRFIEVAAQQIVDAGVDSSGQQVSLFSYQVLTVRALRGTSTPLKEFFIQPGLYLRCNDKSRTSLTARRNARFSIQH
jgi:hypothetical protein